MPTLTVQAGTTWFGIGAAVGGAGVAALLGSPWTVSVALAVGFGVVLLGRRWESPADPDPVRADPAGRRPVTDGGEPGLALVVAIVRPAKLNAVKQALAEAGTPSLTVSNVSGRGTQPSETGQWRGEEYIVDLHQKVKVECAVADADRDRVVEAIQDAARTGEPGDGKIWVLPIEDAVRVSTEERGSAAL